MKISSLHDSQWFRRRWLDFRNGHTIYLAFAMTFTIFVVTTYTLAIERLGFLETVFSSMWQWGILFLAAYIPAAVVMGHLHRKFQIPMETRQITDANPFIYYLQPGREKLYHTPASILSFRTQIQLMAMQNAIADAVEKLGRETNKTIPSIPRFSQSFFREYEKLIYISEQLAKGENLMDILARLEAIQEQGNKEENKNQTLGNDTAAKT